MSPAPPPLSTPHAPLDPFEESPGAGADSSLELDQMHPSVVSTVQAYGSSGAGYRRAHADTPNASLPATPLTRQVREELTRQSLSLLATAPVGAGNRAIHEQPDPYLLCFETDLERVRYSPAFRRLAGKCQVFVAPANDMIRTRLTHTFEVAAIASSVASAAGLCVSLAEAIATAHDCGHGPGGHAAEEALSPYVPGGFDHAVWGADVVLAPLNLCAETLDGVRNHSWKRPAPSTGEGEVVSWADRIAYVVADYSDALRAGVLDQDSLPLEVRARAGSSEAEQMRFFTQALIRGTCESGQVGMHEDDAAVLDLFRQHNFERIYLRRASVRQAEKVISILRSLVDFYTDAPGQLPSVLAREITQPHPGSDEACFEAVKFVASMTDRYAFSQARSVLGWIPPDPVTALESF